MEYQTVHIMCKLLGNIKIKKFISKLQSYNFKNMFFFMSFFFRFVRHLYCLYVFDYMCVFLFV